MSIGQKLYLIEQASIDTDTYIVHRGDTLYSISRKFNIPVEELKTINNLTSNSLSIGQILLVPKENVDIDEEIIEDNYPIYTVQRGDSLWKIAREFDIPVNKLIEANNLSNLTLQVGQQLIIPTEKINYEENTYIVKKGDTLWSIARENNVSVSELKEINNLASNMLSIGQVLKIK